MKFLATRVRKAAVIVIASLCVIIGFLTAPTPLPTGVPLIAIGVVILVTVSATARYYVKKARERSGALDRGFVFVETRAGRNMATMLKRTRPLRRKIEGKAALKAAGNAIKSVRAGGKKGGGEPQGPRAVRD
ncbi:hypothetical protein [Acuticoccus sp.]|uniref:hypothetical protein n=1 Tax=Acuticoccus sp. TaxID=1904378 RepID=UPI003B51F390